MVLTCLTLWAHSAYFRSPGGEERVLRLVEEAFDRKRRAA